MANQSDLKQLNKSRILAHIRATAAQSRAAIADALSLDRKSITNLVSELIAADWLCEVGTQVKRRGRPGTLLALDREKHLFLGLHLSENLVQGVLINLHGEILSQQSRSFALPAGLEDIKDCLLQVYRRLSADLAVAPGAIGLVLPGVLDFEAGRILRSVNLPALDGLAPQLLLPETLPLPLFIEESSRAKALAELWFGLGRKQASFVAIDLGIGIGAGIVAERRLHGGSYAGEIGHVQIEPEGRTCACGNRGCLEAYVSEQRLCQELSRVLPHTLHSLRELETEELNAEALTLLQEAGHSLGRGLAPLVNILCPPLLVLHGNLTRFDKVLMPALMLGLQEAALPSCLNRVRLEISQFGAEAAALGAAAIPFEQIFALDNGFGML